jgi:predicted F0F1-ATPase subunit
VKKKELNIWEMIDFSSQIGFSIIVPIVVGALLGKEIDTHFNSTPKVTLTFIFLGMILGIYSTIKIVKRIIK